MLKSLPCPFCNSASLGVIELEPNSNVVACEDCGAQGPVEETEALAVENWNRRFDVHGGVVLPRVQG